MHHKLGTPKLELIGKGRWRLVEPFSYATLAGCTITVPAGFETDGASSLGLLIEPWGGHYPVAALVHDYLYDRRNRAWAHPCAPTRKAADRILREICRRSGVGPLVRFGMFLAIRLFGGNSLIKSMVVR